MSSKEIYHLRVLSCGCRMLDTADPKTKSTIVECKRHRNQMSKYLKGKKENATD